MADFLEERINELVRYGASYQDDYSVNIVKTSGGQEYRSLIHPFPLRKFDVSYMLDKASTYAQLLGIYHRAHGTFAGFRVRCYDEWSTNGATGTPTAFDQSCAAISAGATYQARKYYGTDKSAGATGYAYRNIKKPVSGTVLLAIGATAIRSADFSIDTTTGIFTFSADVTRSITSIGQSSQAQIVVGSGHSFIAGMSVQVSGVSGMTQINGLRALIVSTNSTSITVAINSSAFSTYTAGGVVHTRPQAGELVTWGGEWDFPVRFATTLPVGIDYPGYRPVDGVQLIELLNP